MRGPFFGPLTQDEEEEAQRCRPKLTFEQVENRRRQVQAKIDAARDMTAATVRELDHFLGDQMDFAMDLHKPTDYIDCIECDCGDRELNWARAALESAFEMLEQSVRQRPGWREANTRVNEGDSPQ